MTFDPKVKELLEKAEKEKKEVLSEFNIDDFVTPDVVEEVMVKGVGKVRFKRVTTEDLWSLKPDWKTDGEYTTRLIAIMLGKVDSKITFDKLKQANPQVTASIFAALSGKMVFLKAQKNLNSGSAEA